MSDPGYFPCQKFTEKRKKMTSSPGKKIIRAHVAIFETQECCNHWFLGLCVDFFHVQVSLGKTKQIGMMKLQPVQLQ